MTPLEMMSASLKGGLLREGKYLGTMTRSVASHTLCFSTYAEGRTGNCPKKSSPVLLQELRSYLEELPDHLDEVHNGAAAGDNHRLAALKATGKATRAQGKSRMSLGIGLCWLLPVSSIFPSSRGIISADIS